MSNEHAQRLAALMGTLSAIELAFDAVTVLAIPGLFEAISRRDESEVGRLIVQAVMAELSEDVREAMEVEQDRAQAMDVAAHAEDLGEEMLAMLRGLMPVAPCSLTPDGS